MSEIKLVALDLDGTLFNSQGKITPASIRALQDLIRRGIYVVISTGRPYTGMPFAQLKGLDIPYALTTNGSAVYEVGSKKLIYEAPLPDEDVITILEFLKSTQAHVAAFIDGDGITPEYCRSMVPNLILPDSIKETLTSFRHHEPDLVEYMQKHHCHITKITLNFQRGEDGELIDRERVRQFLAAMPGIELVCGGYENLEFTRAGIDKGVGLRKLGEYLGLSVDEIMAVGDSENDLAALKAAGTAVAMANSSPEILAVADFITLSNDEDGVAYAIEKLVK